MFVFHILQYILTIFKCIKQITYVYLRNYIFNIVLVIYSINKCLQFLFFKIFPQLRQQNVQLNRVVLGQSKMRREVSQCHCGTIF